MVGMTEKVDKQLGNVTGGEKRERKKRNVEKGYKSGGIAGWSDKTAARGMSGVIGEVNDGDEPLETAHVSIADAHEEIQSPIEDTHMEETRIEETQIESQMEDVACGDEM